MSADDPEQLAAWLDSVANDPVKFVETAFSWGQGELEKSSGPEPWQRWLLEQIRDGLKTPGEAIKIALASGQPLSDRRGSTGRKNQPHLAFGSAPEVGAGSQSPLQAAQEG
jgi:hypothetical protein